MKRYAGLFTLLLAVLMSACNDQQAVSPAPVIASFSADPGTLAVADSVVTLSWKIEGAPTSLSIEPGIGAVSGNNIRVAPAKTTTYTLTASNGAVSDSAEVTVTVPEETQTDPLTNDQLFGSWAFELDGQAGTTVSGVFVVDSDFAYDGKPGVFGLVTRCKSKAAGAAEAEDTEDTDAICPRIPLGGFIHEPGSDGYRFGLGSESLTLFFIAEDADGKLSADAQGRPLLEGVGLLADDEPAAFRVYKSSRP